MLDPTPSTLLHQIVNRVGEGNSSCSHCLQPHRTAGLFVSMLLHVAHLALVSDCTMYLYYYLYLSLSVYISSSYYICVCVDIRNCSTELRNHIIIIFYILESIASIVADFQSLTMREADFVRLFSPKVTFTFRKTEIRYT